MNDNTLVNNNISSNQYGYPLFDNSLNNNFKENIVSNNNYGVYIRYSKNNKIYNNNFVNNFNHAEAYFYSTDNVFNMAMPVGGIIGIILTLQPRDAVTQIIITFVIRHIISPGAR